MTDLEAQEDLLVDLIYEAYMKSVKLKNGNPNRKPRRGRNLQNRRLSSKHR